jgi:hypothetical protein
MNINIDNEITAAIDAQLIIAPQYGVMGLAPRIDPSNGGPKGSKKSCHRNTTSSTYNVQNVRTRDLKITRDILNEEVRCIREGKLQVSDRVSTAMLARLDLMNQEMVRRDFRDYTARKRKAG